MANYTHVVSIVIPVYRDADALARLLSARDILEGVEVVVAMTADDASLESVRAAYPDVIWVEAPRGRAVQMNAGAAAARGRWLIFLHADTHLPREWRAAVDAADRDPRVSLGCFRFALDSRSLFARAIETGVRLRVGLFGLPYGDQALFVRRDVFSAIGGYADVPIMEDVDLVLRLRAEGQLLRSPLHAVTSARRWEADGWVRRTARHLALIARYLAGTPPDRLVRHDPARNQTGMYL
jgi:rSAM/selenodomain-associated transferase 2